MQRQPYISRFSFYAGRYGEGKCGYCGAPLPKRRRNWCSDECVRKIAAEGNDFRALREMAFKRDGYACVNCNSTKNLECDHIIPVELAPERQNLVCNLQTLCSRCHKLKTKQDIRNIAAVRRGKMSRERIIRGEQTKIGE